MKKTICLLLLVCAGLKAQIPSGYYNSAQGLTGTPLRLALHNIIDNHTSISYNALWTAFQTTDKKPNGKVWDMYSDIPSGTPPYQYTFGTDQCGSYSNEGDCYNREHVWPQSFFNSDPPMVSDLFHIYPTDGKVNGIRSNYAFGPVGVTVYDSTLNGGKRGLCENCGTFQGTVFEPIDAYKGDIARSIFYMATRYYTEDATWTLGSFSNKTELYQWTIDILINWHHFDPVSTKEINRNNVVYGIQDNRNPFIDHPEWADSIFIATPVGLKTQSEPVSISLFPNPNNGTFSVTGLAAGESANLVVYNCLGEQVFTKNCSSGDIKAEIILQNGIYYFTLSTGKGKVFTGKFIAIEGE